MSHAASEFRNLPSDQPFSLRARWVFPVWGPPLENGLIEILGGRITAVHDRPGPCTIDLRNAAIIPGLVNAHTHLELSDLAAPLHPNLPFTAWLKAVMAHRRTRTHTGTAPSSSDDAFEKRIVAQGRREAADWGTTTMGDIAGGGASLSETSTNGPRVVPFLEILGLAPERVAGQLERARAHLAEPGLARGLSPHAPYSVHPDLVRGLVDLAVASRAPVAMHLAETRAELELLGGGAGELV
jgi:cytosine/adenosine deaminase-related metal-dependent hydrolase